MSVANVLRLTAEPISEYWETKYGRLFWVSPELVVYRTLGSRT